MGKGEMSIQIVSVHPQELPLTFSFWFSTRPVFARVFPCDKCNTGIFLVNFRLHCLFFYFGYPDWVTFTAITRHGTWKQHTSQADSYSELAPNVPTSAVSWLRCFVLLYTKTTHVSSIVCMILAAFFGWSLIDLGWNILTSMASWAIVLLSW